MTKAVGDVTAFGVGIDPGPVMTVTLGQGSGGWRRTGCIIIIIVARKEAGKEEEEDFVCG